MHSFQRNGNELFCEQVKLETLACKYGTPLYVYSKATLIRHFQVFDRAFGDFPHLVCFSVKANPSAAVLSVLRDMGAGADIVSGGELYRSLRAGIPPERIVYSGVGKTESEMRQALEAGILMFNIESFQELEVLDRVAGGMNLRAPISLRVNPDVDPETHPYVATGLQTSKFGIRFNDAVLGYERARALENIDVVGLDCHIGSQLTDLGPFIESVHKLKDLLDELRNRGIEIDYLDIGGGLGITYEDENPPTPAEYGEAIKAELSGQGVTLILEPGRNLVGNAGILLARVLYVKQAGKRCFLVVDAGMNDLLRPSLYGSYHSIVPVVDRGRSGQIYDVVGPICESGDFLARDRKMPEMRPGELIAVMSAGAYGFSMASTYNSRPLAAEVMVSKDRHFLVRERGTYQDLVRGEQGVPEHL